MRFGAQHEVERTPRPVSILPQEAYRTIRQRQLPELHCDSRVLEEGECCHYADCAIYEKKIRRPRSAEKRPAGIFRSRGRRENSGDAVLDIVFEQISGMLYITENRVLFFGEGEYWSRDLKDLLTVKPYLNCVKFQFGKESYKVFVPDGSIPHAVVCLLQNAEN